jgi:hypothetical protein
MASRVVSCLEWDPQIIGPALFKSKLHAVKAEPAQIRENAARSFAYALAARVAIERKRIRRGIARHLCCEGGEACACANIAPIRRKPDARVRETVYASVRTQDCEGRFAQHGGTLVDGGSLRKAASHAPPSDPVRRTIDDRPPGTTVELTLLAAAWGCAPRWDGDGAGVPVDGAKLRDRARPVDHHLEAIDHAAVVAPCDALPGASAMALWPMAGPGDDGKSRRLDIAFRAAAQPIGAVENVHRQRTRHRGRWGPPYPMLVQPAPAAAALATRCRNEGRHDATTPSAGIHPLGVLGTLADPPSRRASSSR